MTLMEPAPDFAALNPGCVLGLVGLHPAQASSKARIANLRCYNARRS
jgi:hypothetical protein